MSDGEETCPDEPRGEFPCAGYDAWKTMAPESYEESPEERRESIDSRARRRADERAADDRWYAAHPGPMRHDGGRPW